MSGLTPHLDTMPTNPSAWCSLFEASFTASEGADEGQAIRSLAENLLAHTRRADLNPCWLETKEVVVAAICLTRLTFAQETGPIWLLSPVAVHPDHWKTGKGSTLIRAAMAHLRSEQAAAIVTYGDPGYYGRFGFEHVAAETVRPPHALSMPMGWQAKSLKDGGLSGLSSPSRAVAAFDDPALW
ncbi:GNAT family N-acetyltransferase [Pontivivens insulae]|uniref:N-acetyltransferase domain-containing protein n=1 Tax=Pontivivens insulae TaxID=1639689 RepID=A0A2R8ABC8_9RHOB|nr:N-acetyltransferase [Pontivivens insulae]RED11310.1 putative acetyltransferase [Pontivivens insulae]SPF29517.1 hypothetical protein POI8812_01828 [Pontivivens insulae]